MDLDGDGKLDILSGSYSRQDQEMAGLFQVLRGNEDGTFRAAEALNGSDGNPLIIAASENKPGYEDDIVKICTRPMAVDWDGDGKLDLVVGNFTGTFYWFKGEGRGQFNPTAEPLKVGEDLLSIEGHHSDPFCVDWDKDGDLDILSGSTNGGVQWSENTAGSGSLPVLKKFVSLVPPGARLGSGEMLKENELKEPTRSTRVWVDDIDEDGKLDILVGDSTTLVSAAEGLTEDEAKAKEKEWNEKMEELQKELTALGENRDSDEAQNAYKKLGELYQDREKFLKEERTGYVWLYLQK